jgi:hypothetical protein
MPLKLRAVKKRSSSMANEGNAQGIDDLLDEVPEETTAEETPEQVETPVETPAEETPAEETTETAAEEVEETESQVAKLFDVDHSGQTVPVDKHAKLRKRAQEAEARAAAAEAKLAQNVDTAPLDELSSLIEGEDDEVIEKKDLKKIVEKLPQTIAQIATKTTNQALTNVQLQNMAARAKADEVAFKKEHPDYDAKVSVAMRQRLLTDDELREVGASDNIAEAMYNKSKAAIEQLATAIGITQQPTTEEKPPTGNETPVNDDEPLDDEAGFEMFMSGDQSS